MSSPGDISLEEDDMDAYYGAQAEAYRNWSSSLESRIQSNDDLVAYRCDIQRLNLTIAKRLAGDGTVVEIGCGPSRLRSIGRHRSLVLIDRVSAMLREARRAHGDQLRAYIQADGQHLPLRNSVADLIICTFVLSHLDEHSCQQVLSEVRRVLRPNGVAIISDSARSMVPTAGVDLQTRRAANGRVYRVPKYYRTAAQMCDMFSEGSASICGKPRFVFTIEWRHG